MCLESLDKQKFNQIKLNLSRNKIYLDDINLPFNVSRTTQIKSLFTGENIKVFSFKKKLYNKKILFSPIVLFLLLRGHEKLFGDGRSVNVVELQSFFSIKHRL